MRRLLPFVLVTIVGLGALIGGTLLYRAKRVAVLTISKEQIALAKDGGESAHVRGRRDSPVTLEEFGDLQCPPCGTLSEPINQMEKDYRGRLRVIFHHFPLAIHAHALEAALAAEAAGLQGRFWQMHDLLYREQSAWSEAAAARPLFEAYAGTLGLDLNRFERDLDSEEVTARVTADEKLGAKLGISKTPTVFVNNLVVPADSLRPERLRAFVEAAVKAKTSR
jgi:protein-disulfide isomerase